MRRNYQALLILEAIWQQLACVCLRLHDVQPIAQSCAGRKVGLQTVHVQHPFPQQSCRDSDVVVGCRCTLTFVGKCVDHMSTSLMGPAFL